MSNQYLKLRRSGVPGKIPSTSSIDYGEIALNTHDGLAYMKVSGSGGIRVVPIGSSTGSFSGSFTGNFSGSFTGSLYGTSSWAENYNETDPIFVAKSASFATTGSNTFNGDQRITGSLNVSGSGSFTNGLLIESSNVLVNPLLVKTTDNANILLIKYNGAIGINNSNPVYSLDVTGTGRFTDTLRINQDKYLQFMSPLFDGFGIKQDTSNRLVIDNNNDIENPYTALSIINSPIDQISNGLVGIFITNPTATLDVSGSGRFTNGLTITGSLKVSGSITGSLQGTASWADNALTASYINTLNQNVTVVGNQTISGSLTVRDNLIVLGSASIQHISESTLNIGTNLITVNTFNPGARFGGLAVIDSGSSPLVSASFLYDSVQDEFIFVHKGTAGGAITSSHFVLGPETYNDQGNEIYLTANRIPKGTGIEHLNDSNISDNGSIVSINSNTQVTGSLAVSAGISGSFSGSGADLFGIPASGIVGLNLSQITSGSVSASVSPAYGFAVNGLSAGSGSGDVVMYNTSSGQFFFTASAAIGGGGGNASNDNFQQIFLLMGG